MSELLRIKNDASQAGFSGSVFVSNPGSILVSGIAGDRQEAIFEDDADRGRFLETLAAVCLKTGWQVHAYCLLGNHFHLVVETPQANLVAGVQ
jgi:hypothetical protein